MAAVLENTPLLDTETVLRTGFMFIRQMDLHPSRIRVDDFFFPHKCENEGKHFQSSIKMRNSSNELIYEELHLRMLL